MTSKVVKIASAGYLDESGKEGFVQFQTEDGKLFTMSSFGGEVSFHINRFMASDRSSVPTIYNLVEQLGDKFGYTLGRVEIYQRSGVLRASLFFNGKGGEIIFENYRASDATVLAMLYDAPIFMDEDLFE
ncbi:MAG: bifunctional nuclease family protein [Thaumarchaeota archaeon]|jgi:bifunctional DNase/RNase|nr:bifunctional nuclease family protein [Nitrososphaerota archaeon]